MIKLLHKYLTRRDTGLKTILYFCLNIVIESLILIMGNYLKAIVLKNHKINTSFVSKNLWPLGANTTGFDLNYIRGLQNILHNNPNNLTLPEKEL